MDERIGRTHAEEQAGQQARQEEAQDLGQRRFDSFLMAIFGALALLLAAVGRKRYRWRPLSTELGTTFEKMLPTRSKLA